MRFPKAGESFIPVFPSRLAAESDKEAMTADDPQEHSAAWIVQPDGTEIELSRADVIALLGFSPRDHVKQWPPKLNQYVQVVDPKQGSGDET